MSIMLSPTAWNTLMSVFTLLNAGSVLVSAPSDVNPSRRPVRTGMRGRQPVTQGGQAETRHRPQCHYGNEPLFPSQLHRNPGCRQPVTQGEGRRHQAWVHATMSRCHCVSHCVTMSTSPSSLRNCTGILGAPSLQPGRELRETAGLITVSLSLHSVHCSPWPCSPFTVNPAPVVLSL